MPPSTKTANGSQYDDWYEKTSAQCGQPAAISEQSVYCVAWLSVTE
jgi:hypothetical protein